MTVALARKTVIHEWPRFLPAVVAVAFAGVLILVQAGLVLGIFASASVYVTASTADLWLGYPGTQSMELGRPIPAASEMHMRMDPAVVRVEPVLWQEGDWRGPRERGGVSVYVTGVDTDLAGLMFSLVLTADLRRKLNEPGAALVDPADLPKLGIAVGEYAEISGKRVHVLGTVPGLRTLGGVNVVTSLATARFIGGGDDHALYFVGKLRDPAQAETVARRLTPSGDAQRFAVWTRNQFADRAILFWLLDTGAGLGFLFGGALVLLVGAVIASQTLMGAVAGSAREYATLRALGVGLPSLRRVVLAQSGWIAAAGVLLGAVLSVVILGLARSQSVPVYLGTYTPVLCILAMLIVAMASGWMAARALQRAEPASLLR